MALLEIRDLNKSFVGLKVLTGTTLSIEEGSITAIIGPNGAGKSTLFNVLSGLFKPDGGSVAFAGQDIAGQPPHEITRQGLVRTFQISRGFPNLTVMESLLVYGAHQPGERLWHALIRSRAMKRREGELVERARAVAEQLRLTHVLDNLAVEISGGQKKLLEIGRALMATPRLILLDEPMAGVNPSLGNEIGDRIIELNGQGYTFAIVEHSMDWVRRLCDPVVVLAEGRTLTQGRFDDVIADPRVQDVYMGVGA